MLGGGSGTARLLAGIKAQLGWDPTGPAVGADTVTAIVSTGGDIRLHNLHVSADLDACLYATAGVLSHDAVPASEDPSFPDTARADETFAVATELERYGAEAPWYRLGDKDIATHLMRTRMLDAGYRLSQVTAALCAHWQTGVRLLPMTDDRVETHVIVAAPAGSIPDDDAAAADRAAGPDQEEASIVAIHLREWERRFQASLPPLAITPIAAEDATPAPGVLEAIAAAGLIVIGPDNPVTALGSVFAVPGIREALAAASAPVIGVSPVAAGQPVVPGATAGLSADGVEATARGIAGYYGARAAGGLLDGWLCGPDDAVLADDTVSFEGPMTADDGGAGEGADGLAGLRVGRTRIDLSSAESARAVAAAIRDLAGV